MTDVGDLQRRADAEHGLFGDGMLAGPDMREVHQVRVWHAAGLELLDVSAEVSLAVAEPELDNDGASMVPRVNCSMALTWASWDGARIARSKLPRRGGRPPLALLGRPVVSGHSLWTSPVR